MNIKFELETLWLRYQKQCRRNEPIRWFTSDLHFYHKNVIEYCNRPFKDVMEMNAALIRRWNAMVKPIDTVYCLGDFSMNANRMRDVAPLLNGKKYLVPGNHDEVFWSKKPSKVQKYLDAGWNIMSKHELIYINRYLVRLSHMPYGDEEAKKYDTRYFEHRPIKSNEDIILHGHLHCRYVKQNDRIDVGIDHNFKLYSEQDIIKLIKGPAIVKSRLDGQLSKSSNREAM